LEKLAPAGKPRRGDARFRRLVAEKDQSGDSIKFGMTTATD